MLSKRHVLVLASAAIFSLTVVSAPASAAGAVVIIQRGGSDCGVGAGDIPGLPGFDLASSTVVVTPNGALTVTCHRFGSARRHGRGHLRRRCNLRRGFRVHNAGSYRRDARRQGDGGLPLPSELAAERQTAPLGWRGRPRYRRTGGARRSRCL